MAGVRPYENDDAKGFFQDTLCEMFIEIGNLLGEPLDESNYNEHRACAWLLTKIGRKEVYGTNLDTHLTIVHDRLQAIKNDLAYVATWPSPTEFIKDLDELIQQIQRVCKWNGVTITF